MSGRERVSPGRSFAVRGLLVALAAAGLLVLWLNTGLAARFLERLFFLTTVQEVADRYGVEPQTVLAIIYVESSFNPSAQSDPGAVGLMQVMPVTAREIGAELGYRPDRIDLRDPRVNILFGTHYLAKLQRQYGDLETALQAYNAGGAALDAGDTAGEHPYPETRQFVENVKRWRWRFGDLLEGKAMLTWGTKQ